MALSISQMARMSELLEQALPLDATGRQAWLASASKKNPDLASVLFEALLPGEVQAAEQQSLLSLPRLVAVQDAAPAAANRLYFGARVGPYELMQLLGAGGMAEVWLARRADGAFKREVALKLPTASHVAAGLEARFARECDILASLEHPHIARLYDAGMDALGRPYLSMEYIRGEPLTSWCESRRLGIDARVALLLQVLEAVRYAHQRQVIHRDIKPANILVSETGQVHLLDFGIARMLESEETDQPALTKAYGRALTPDYASPELLRGDPIDERSDLYSLGVVLYELLTGTQPYRLKRAAAIGALDQAIATVEVKSPSTQVTQSAAAARNTTAPTLVRHLREDLDAITLKALAKNPEHRYASALAMAEDLQCHLDGKPVYAQPARVFYRLRKIVSRNRTSLTIGIIALAAILVLVGYTLDRERRAATTVSGRPTVPLTGTSIAVLPFTDMSAKHDQEYFSDGLSEDLIDLLAKVPNLRVPARTSAFYFKGRSTKLREIATELGVTHVLEGSVRKSGDRLRITVKLVRVDNGYDIWSQSYDRQEGDVLQIQDDIAQAVVAALGPKLGVDASKTAPRGSVVSEAYDDWLLARSLMSNPQPGNGRRAMNALENAIRLDPNFAPAYATLAFVRCNVAANNGQTELFGDADALLEKALSLSPGLPDIYSARSQCRLFELDLQGSLADAKLAVAGAPGDARFQIALAYALAANGNFERAIAAANVGTSLDPLNIWGWVTLGQCFSITHDWTAARRSLERALQITPAQEDVIFALGTLDLLEGHAEKALATFATSTSELDRTVGTALALFSLGRDPESRELLAKLSTTHSAYLIAQVHAWRGERDDAMRDLDVALTHEDPRLASIRLDPVFVGMQIDERYRRFLNKIDQSH